MISRDFNFLDEDKFMKILKKISDDIVPLSSKQHFLLFLIIAFIFQFIFFALPSLADEINASAAKAAGLEGIIKIDSVSKDQSVDQEAAKYIKNPEEKKTEKNEALKVVKSSTHRITAYNSEVGQTDDSPCITANGFNVCKHGEEDTIAANFLAFGTKVRIPELFGDRIFVVRDRMSTKHNNKVDVWMKNRTSAIKFGVRTAKIEILADANTK